MKLLTEIIDRQDLEFLSEGHGDTKTFKIKGPFIQAEVENRNKRVYPKNICEREVQLFNRTKILTKRAMGELDHPPSPMINLDRVSHLIESLEMQGNNAIGVAKLLDTPLGKIAKSLLSEGVQLGVSTRGIGTMTGQKVNSDYRLITVDIVADPSAPSAFVEGILENKEWIMDGDNIVEVAISEMKKKLDKHGSKVAYEAVSQFLKDLKTKL